MPTATPSLPKRGFPILCAFVFLAGAATMVVELAAGRLVARHLGMSLYTWTAIIGVILAGMSLGNHLGGRVADRYAPVRALRWLFFCAGLSCLAVLPANAMLGAFTPLSLFPWPLRIAAHVALVFFAPALLLGAISPVAANLAVSGAEHAGRRMGVLFACGALGSIGGTFLTGFVLVFVLGVTAIFVLAACVLLILGALTALLPGGVQTPVPILETASPAMPLPWRDRAIPCATVFLSNAAFMTIELAASRVLARQFGASLFTWTTIIGVVLAGVSLGNWIGGRLPADRTTSRRTLSLLFLGASMALLATPWLCGEMSNTLAASLWLRETSWPLRIFLFTLFGFFAPCLFLGAISPVVARRFLDTSGSAGRALGGFYAWGALGGIVATFLTGYGLIAWLGPVPLLVANASLLGFVALAFRPRSAIPIFWAIAAALALSIAFLPSTRSVAEAFAFRTPCGSDTIYETDSHYAHIAVLSDPDRKSLRALMIDKLTHSIVDLDAPQALKYEYEWIYENVTDRRFPDHAPVHALVIGGGGYAFPHYLELARPGSQVEVAEIDPAVTEAAHAALGLPRDTGIAIHHEDARNRVAELIRLKRSGGDAPPFDCIFGDSINDYTVPFHLTTLEFTRQVSELLGDRGVYLLNLIDCFQFGGFVSGVTNTCRQVFPYVYVFDTGRPESLRDTFVVIGAKQPIDLAGVGEAIKSAHGCSIRQIPNELLDAAIARNGGRLLTDDYAPVENLLAPVVLTRQEDLGILYFEYAGKYLQAKNVSKALEMCQRALDIHPEWPDALIFLAERLREQDDLDGALAAARRVSAALPQYGKTHFQLARDLWERQRFDEGALEMRAACACDKTQFPGLVTLATEALRANQPDLAISAWGAIADIQPESVANYYNLGLALASKQRYEDAIGAWRKALTINAKHEDSLYNLAAAYALTKRYDDAWDVVTLMRKAGLQPDAGLLQRLREASGRDEGNG
jgi:pentatricopeptide repeat protein